MVGEHRSNLPFIRDRPNLKTTSQILAFGRSGQLWEYFQWIDFFTILPPFKMQVRTRCYSGATNSPDQFAGPNGLTDLDVDRTQMAIMGSISTAVCNCDQFSIARIGVRKNNLSVCDGANMGVFGSCEINSLVVAYGFPDRMLPWSELARYSLRHQGKYYSERGDLTYLGK